MGSLNWKLEYKSENRNIHMLSTPPISNPIPCFLMQLVYITLVENVQNDIYALQFIKKLLQT